MHIDPHVHCRDWNQAYKATIKSASDLARNQGIVAIFDMPNTDPPITSKDLVRKRLKLAEQVDCSDIYHLYIGATKNPKQIRECAEVVKKYPKVVGIKMFAGKSVGDLTIISEKDQARVYQELAQVDYDGVLAVHCEKESSFKMELWNSNNPATWNLTRPIEAEVDSIEDQIRFAEEAGFEGNLHILHATSSKAVEVVQKAKSKLRITCGATPHHLTLSTLNMRGRKGLRYKVNPPLRDYETMLGLRDCLKEEKIDWIETDHAPHMREEKLFLPYMSGIQSLKFYSEFLNNLRSWGFTENQIHRLTYENIKNVFNL
ncbi:MAG: hypothetical protein ACE5J3_02285 [Methanosarcinales archaeon]